MKILLGDTCLKTASAAISEKNKLIAYMHSEGHTPHSVMFPKLVEQVINTAKLQFSDLDAIACVNGPGSFTGQRIGLTYMKTLAYTLDKPFYTLNTLDVLANSQKAKDDVLSLPLIDARNNEVFTAMYMNKDGFYINITPYSALHIDKVVEMTVKMCEKNDNLVVMLSGDAQKKHIGIFKNALDKKIMDYSAERDNVDLTRAPLLLTEDYREDPFLALPFYLRESGAVRMKKNKE